MNGTSPNLRKAAVLVRSLDAETAASLLAQLSPDEAAALRAAVQSLGPIDPEERADVVAEFRRAAPMAARSAADGVELSLTPSQIQYEQITSSAVHSAAPNAKRFEFLDNAPIAALAPCLAREHVQTIALVLSHLPPARAASVLAALPHKLQADTVERLALLGETDPESVIVVESELAEWMATRSVGRPGSARRSDSVGSILAAADATTRHEIIANLTTHKAALARQLAISQPVRNRRSPKKAAPSRQAVIHDAPRYDRMGGHIAHASRRSVKPAPAPLPRYNFDELIHLNNQMLSGLLRDADPNVLALALAGSHDELIDRICGQMPKRTAREFRRRLRQLGPTRLSDVEAAQQAVARIAAQRLNDLRTKRLASST